MPQQTPIFPLQLIAFPGEVVALHIFEPRYIALVNHCLETGDYFGLVPVYEEQVSQVATAMRISELHEQYPDGRMDIRVVGEQVLSIVEYHPSADPDTSHKATIEARPLLTDAPQALRDEVTQQYRLFHRLIQTIKTPELVDDAPLSFQIGHTSGLEMPKQIKLLDLPDEASRLVFLQVHFDQVIPSLRGIELTRSKIQQNGHFKTLPPQDIGIR